MGQRRIEQGTSADEGRWQFWIDRGGTFTDVVARRPDGRLLTHKLLSENPRRYQDAALQAIRDLLGLDADADIPAARIGAVKMGTTVATNALLERKGEPVLLVITEGFADALRIAYQNRPDLFVRHIILPERLYTRVLEIDERVLAGGEVRRPLDAAAARAGLEAAYAAGLRACAIVFMHGYRFPDHEQAVARIAAEVGFTQISVSSAVSPLMKLIGRGDTTIVDAYLSPILRRYVDRVAAALGGARLMFMQSSGGLTDARFFQGKDSILSGPAGGIVGAVRSSARAGFGRIIGFDMGGTSTDVSHYDGEYERSFETRIAGVRMRTPMMRIHTVAAGGGSICHFDGGRYRVGPASAGADPGPACYRRGGPLTVTDCNLMLGRINPDHFPKLFGDGGDQPLDREVVRDGFIRLAEEIGKATGDRRSPEQVAAGFLRIAIDNMAHAIKQISVARGYDVSDYALCCFGGAGGQHACQVADALGMRTVFIHPLAGVLSAYGMGLADMNVMREKAIEARLEDCDAAHLQAEIDGLAEAGRAELAAQGVAPDRIAVKANIHLRYEGTDTALMVPYEDYAGLNSAFATAYRQRFAFTMPDKKLVIEAVSIEAVGVAGGGDASFAPSGDAAGPPLAPVSMVCDGHARQTPVFARAALAAGAIVAGPALIVEDTATTVIEPGWSGEVTGQGDLVLRRREAMARASAVGTDADPVMLEIFNNLFMAIAEQMGVTLENTAYSVNIKERLDFSCALFDGDGRLIANAPHMPVHLGSMGETVAAIIAARRGSIRPGEVFAHNAPYNGGTHLPDITVVTPVFDADGRELLFYVAARGHHADIGGISPGSMPPDSRNVGEEGVLIDNFTLVEGGRFREAELRSLLGSGDWPVRNPEQNIADLKAQIAANEKGAAELRRMVDHYGLDVVRAYMGHVQDNAEEAVRRVIVGLRDGAFAVDMDDGGRIEVRVEIDRAARRARIDFTGSSPVRPTNFNAPASVCRAAVLYVLRTLVDDHIPMNEGCLKPVDLIIPEGSMLDPTWPAAVVAGNVETSQCIVDALYGALGVMAAAQGTMNNFTFGDARFQYYETIAGGTGAGQGFDGASAVQSHMTNSRLTDPEVLEWRFPMLVERFSLRPGSGGEGRWRGGDGVLRRLRFLAPMEAAILSGRRAIPPFGLEGGAAGAPGRNRVERADGQIEELGATARVEMQIEDSFIIETPGGGGFGATED